MSKDERPRENFPGGDVVPEEGELRVSIDKKAYTEMMCHVREEDTDIEIGGVFVGKLKQDRHGEFLHILHSIRGEKANRKGAQVTFTHDTWSHINREKDTKYADLDVVGWYHTHPGFDIFLSDMDKFIQKQFFYGPHQVAFVYDPHQGTEGFFRNKGEEIVMLERYWHGGKPRRTVPPDKRLKVALPDSGKGTSTDLGGTLAALTDSVRRLENEVRASQGGSSWSMMIITIILVIGILTYAYATFMKPREREVFLEIEERRTGQKIMIQVETKLFRRYLEEFDRQMKAELERAKKANEPPEEKPPGKKP